MKSEFERIKNELITWIGELEESENLDMLYEFENFMLDRESEIETMNEEDSSSSVL